MVHMQIKQNMKTNMYWTQATSYGDFEINWEYKEEASEKETYDFICNE